MSWSFDIKAGDLTFVSSKSGAAIVTGKNKTFQDLKNGLLEPMGTDTMHPEYGSLLDGGTLPDGTPIDSYIGKDSLSVYKIEEEIVRVVQSFIDKQNTRVNSDIATFGRSTVSDSEIIESIGSITNKRFNTKLVMQVNLVMRNGNTVSITQPVG